MRIIVLGDLHFPYHDKVALKKVISYIDYIKPTHIVQIGDLYDFFSATRFPKSSTIDPAHEYLSGYEFAKEMWRQINIVSPNSEKWQIKGNHDVRPIARIVEKCPDLQFFVERGLREFFVFEGVRTIEDPKEELKICGIKFIHGYLSKLGDHMKYFGCNTVTGHSHRGGVFFEQLHSRIVWELNAGFLADETLGPLKYRPTKTSKWTKGFAEINDLGPRFIPL